MRGVATAFPIMPIFLSSETGREYSVTRTASFSTSNMISPN